MSYEDRVANPCIGPNAPISCWRLRDPPMRSATHFRAIGYALRTAACAKACWCRSMREDRVWGGPEESWDKDRGSGVPRQQAAGT
jgi:hypothetical protein